MSSYCMCTVSVRSFFYQMLCDIIRCVWCGAVWREGDFIRCRFVKAATVGSGHRCLCGVLIKIEIYALPAFMGLGHCGDAYLDPPPPLSRQAGREVDIINNSLTTLFHSITPILPTGDQTLPNWWLSDFSLTVTSLIKYEEGKACDSCRGNVPWVFLWDQCLLWGYHSTHRR